MVTRDKKGISGKIRLMIIKLERRETEISYFLSKKRISMFLNLGGKKSKDLTAM